MSKRTVAEAGERRKKAVGPKAMFTGIVEEVGEVSEMFMDIKVPGVTLTLKGDIVLQGAYEGCSISVNGVCLTVTKFTDKEFTVGVAPETLRVTNREDFSFSPRPLPPSPPPYLSLLPLPSLIFLHIPLLSSHFSPPISSLLLAPSTHEQTAITLSVIPPPLFFEAAKLPSPCVCCSP